MPHGCSLREALFFFREKFSLCQPCGLHGDLEKSVCKNNKFHNSIFSEPQQRQLMKKQNSLNPSTQGEDLEILNREAKGLTVLAVVVCSSLTIAVFLSAFGIL